MADTASRADPQRICGKAVSDMAGQDIARLIQKLRWARLEHEAQELELVMGRVPPELRGIISGGPVSTD